MADSVVIREFLVALGFRVDEKGLKNFREGVEGATKGVVRLISTISGAALTVGAGVSAFASKLERLYFVAQRTGAAETSLKSLEFAARNFGVSSEQAIGTVENLARMLRNVPGSEGLLQQMGVQTRDANGNLRDSVDLLTDLGSQLAKLPQYEANAYGGVFGIDENLLLAMRNGDFDKFVKQYREMSKSTGLNKASDDAHKFMVSLRGLGTSFENLGIRVEGAMLQKIGPQLERFQRWMDEHGDEIANRVTDIANAVVKAAAAMGPPLAWLADKFVELDHGTNGWSTKILLLGVALNALGVFRIAGGIWKMVAALRAAGAATTAASAAGGGLLSVLGSLATAAVAVGAAFAGWKIGDAARDKVDGLITQLSGGKYRSLWDVLTGKDRRGLEATGGYTQEEIDSVKDGGGAKLTPPRGAAPASAPAPTPTPTHASAPGPVPAPVALPADLAGAMSRLADTAFGRLISRGEGDYNSVNRGKAGGYKSGTEDLENMTVAQVMAAQRAQRFNAAGRYQIIKDTLAEAARSMGLRGDEKFDRGMQDRIFEQYLVNNKRRAISDYLSGKSEQLGAAIYATAKEWASVAVPKGMKTESGRISDGTMTFYDKSGKNKASITEAQMQLAMQNSRALYQQPQAAAAQMVGRGEASRSVDVKQDVRIEVNGVNEPAAAGREVARHQAQIANDMAREMRGVIA
ncbi:mannosyl-glycoprotein endo-beta-N-acetylglucosamidase [Burkholderia cenocepacia]|uniref:mannosyl-glycoprotein endo-beta-N-acetylglucosamidase n=1 Tax=Burkholderia cenocepacia TaxID=95486 RepID=UPI00097CA074|nr:mannosyl-glycoprotein endo-beta-N-acetylglucosamidase [Burkholderia cenocepacia]AQQ20255.1 mannosyl-glycoprotein endo-beta-N-acetylglucosamidase [Burkholderia cenocepacia]ONJ20010.1 mannosyl-glycoprotein endo-beta-N-acetylglucosamidase [Burkholderia cenocepacia]ONN96073.1 mannosyl-glycoprotein endo-beta-N-acetylglucosamidase [Burkholderia cenocepacia]ONO00522.1 mannosyl-glycoprotein endo-beta-N-acetylglucosamidase [Burkholderia cenocepacia]ONO10613.1 mannosyl-glycoprotein endo-beta-N-acetyl